MMERVDECFVVYFLEEQTLSVSYSDLDKGWNVPPVLPFLSISDKFKLWIASKNWQKENLPLLQTLINSKALRAFFSLKENRKSQHALPVQKKKKAVI